MLHTQWGQLVYNSSGGYWLGTVKANIFRSWHVYYVPDWEGAFDVDEEEAPNDGPRELTAFDPSGDGPSEAQIAAYSHYLANESLLADMVVEALSNNLLAVLEQIDMDPITALATIGLDRVTAIAKMTSFYGLTLLRQEKEGLAYITLDFRCGWDPEHGISILIHGDTLLAVSGMADFTCRGDDLESHAACCRSL